MLDFLNLTIFSFMCSIVAIVYADILVRPGQVLESFGIWMTRKLVKKKENELCVEEDVVHWLYMPLIGCSKCVAGQIALWSYFFWHQGYILGYHIYSICASVLITYLLNKIIFR